MVSALNRWWRRVQAVSVLATFFLCAALVTPCIALAQAQTIRAASTDLFSDSERMVSYRHQEHMWQTSDGALHLVINRGTLTPAPGLALFSSFDGGSSWRLMQALPNTDDESVLDGQLQGNELLIAYHTAGNASIVVASLHYDNVARAWATTRSETAFDNSRLKALNPALATDSTGTIWCAFVARDRVSNATDLRMVYRLAGSNAWSDTGLVFGPTDDQLIERSARPVPIPKGMGVLYTVHDTLYWATRTNELPPNSAWTGSAVYTSKPQKSIADPYASHFSSVVDDQANVHLLLVDDYGIYYLRLAAGATSWSPARKIGGDTKAVYSQIGLANGKLAVGISVKRGQGAMFVSADGGQTFANIDALKLPPPSTGVNYGTARVEMPTRSSGPVAMLQQYDDNGAQRLLLFNVPAP